MTQEEIETRFWKALKSDRTVMLGTRDIPARPMTALLAEGKGNGPLWIFTSQDSELVEKLHQPIDAFATFASKGNDTFATIVGTLTVEVDPNLVDELWNPFVAAWYEGKDDPKLVLLRFDLDTAEIWTDASNLLAGLKILVGSDPKTDYKEKVAHLTY